MTFDENWASFLAAPTTLGPKPDVREAWHQGRRRYAVWILRVADPRVHRRMAEVAEALACPIRRVPDEDAHITLSIGGFRCERPKRDDDVHNHDLEITARALSMTPPEPLTVEVRGAHSFLTCAVLQVRDPTGRLEALRARIGEGLRFGHPWLPHVTVGSYLEDHPIREIANDLDPLRDLPPIEVPVEAVELVDFDAHTPGAPLVTRARLPCRAWHPGTGEEGPG